MLYLLINFICSLIESLCLYLIMAVTFERSRQSYLPDGFLVLLMGILYGFFNDYGTAPAGFILGSLTAVIWALFCLKGRLPHKIACLFTFILCMTLSDWTTMVIASWCRIAGDTPIIVALYEDPPLRAKMMLISKLLLLCIVTVYIYFRRKHKTETTPFSNFLLLTTGLFSISGIILEAIYTINTSQLSRRFHHFSLISPFILAILYLLSLASAYWLSRANNTAYHYERMVQKNKLVQRHYENMQLLQQELTDWNTETLRQLHSLKQILDSGIYDELGQKTPKMQSLLLKQEYPLTGNTVFDIIISQKINQGRRKGIRFQNNIQKIDALIMEEVDIVCLMSNLLDNACEAVENLDSVKRYIYLEIKKQGDYLLIKTENPYRALTIDAKKHLHTTKQNQKLHGHGIHCMKSIAEKYQGFLQFHAEHNIISIKIALKGGAAHETIHL